MTDRPRPFADTRRLPRWLTACLFLLSASLAAPLHAQPAEAPANEVKPALPVPEQRERPMYLTDPAAYRMQACKRAIADLFAIKLDPQPGDTFFDLMPKGTEALPVVNPGFEFTYDNGKKPGNNYWFITFKAGERSPIAGGGQGKTTDPIQGWNTYGCAGLESGREKQWTTQADGCTGYIVAQNHDTYLYQDIEDGLKPNTRYTLLVEVYKRNDYKRAEKNELIVKLTDAQGEPVKIQQADHLVEPADKETGFSVSIIHLTTHADQPPGALRIMLGMNAQGPVRANFDNVRLWAHPVD